MSTALILCIKSNKPVEHSFNEYWPFLDSKIAQVDANNIFLWIKNSITGKCGAEALQILKTKWKTISKDKFPEFKKYNRNEFIKIMDKKDLDSIKCGVSIVAELCRMQPSAIWYVI